MTHHQQQFRPAIYRSSRLLPPATLRETQYDLAGKGYRFKFRREGAWLYCAELDLWCMPDSFKIDEYYHFEADRYTHGDKMLYAISSRQGLKGYLTDTCYVYAGNTSTALMERPDWDYLPAGAF